MGDSIHDRFERYAMHVEELSQQEKKRLDVDSTGADLGMSPIESRKMAELLNDEGWVVLEVLAGAYKIRLTKLGFDEVAKLRWPRYRRWLDKHPRVWGFLGFIAAGFAGIGFFLLGEYLKRNLWPPVP